MSRAAPFTAAEKLACIDRELKLRHQVYANRVRNGLLSPTTAQREIALMESIRQDYLTLAAADNPQLDF